MKKKNAFVLVLALLVMSLLIAACGGALPGSVATQQETSVEVIPEPAKSAEDTMTEKEAMTDEAVAEQEEIVDDEMMETSAAADETMAETEEMAEEAMLDHEEATEQAIPDPAWFKAELTDVNTGETFKLADFRGKVVLVETMAVWCPKCTRQQGQIRALHELVGEREDLISLTLDVDPNESGDILKANANKHGFDWRYAVAPAEVAREIGQLYGAQFLNPPATPILIIDRQGEVHPLPFGHKKASVLQESLEPFLNEG